MSDKALRDLLRRCRKSVPKACSALRRDIAAALAQTPAAPVQPPVDGVREALVALRALFQWDGTSGTVVYRWAADGGPDLKTALSAANAALGAPTAPPSTPPVVGGIALIAAERKRQVEKEGWTPEHDAAHTDDELAVAAACYALPEDLRDEQEGRMLPPVPEIWPWHHSWWKPGGGRTRELVKAGALIAAEIDRRLGPDGPSIAELTGHAAPPVPAPPQAPTPTNFGASSPKEEAHDDTRGIAPPSREGCEDATAAAEAERGAHRALPEPREPERSAQVGAEGGDRDGGSRQRDGSLRPEPDRDVLRPQHAVQRDAEAGALELAAAHVTVQADTRDQGGALRAGGCICDKEPGDSECPVHGADQCGACGEAWAMMSPRWRWNGARWEHECAGRHPQGGHSPARGPAAPPKASPPDDIVTAPPKGEDRG